MTNTKLVSREPSEETLERMVDAYVAYQSPVNRGQAQQIEGMARAFAVAFDAAPAAAAAEPTFNLAPDEAEVARFRTVLAAAIAEPYLTKAHVPNMHSDAETKHG